MPAHLSDGDLIAIRGWAGACPEIAEVWLFGSRARGENRDDSDIDLAVLRIGHEPDERLADWIHEVGTWRQRLKLSRKHHIRPYPEPDDKGDVAESIRREGIRLYP